MNASNSVEPSGLQLLADNLHREGKVRRDHPNDYDTEITSWIEEASLVIAAIAQGQPGCGEPVAWRWQARSWAETNYWIYNPSKEWREFHQSDPKVVFQPLYAAPQPPALRS